jgi:hypothetical protein
MGRGKSAASLRLIATAWAILEEIQPASIRAVCYQLFNRRLLQSMSKNETNRVSIHLRDARERGDIPWNWVVDETREAERVNAWKNPEAFVATVKRAYRRDRWADQSTHVEVWSEKGTVRGTLSPVLDEYGLTFRVMHGYGSATTLHEVAQESAADFRPWVVLYVGDWDPSGLHMSEVDLPTRIARYGGGRLAVYRVALTRDQATDRRLPSFSVDTKRGDSRFTWFVQNYGRRCWELDAMNPVELRDRITSWIETYIDPDAWVRAAVAEQAETESLRSILDTWRSIPRQAPE